MAREWVPGAVKGKPGLDRLKTPGKVRARYRDADGKQHSKVHDSVTDAERWLIDQKSSVNQGEHIAPADGRMTLEEFVQDWKAVGAKAPGTRKKIESVLRRHILPAFGHRRLDSIRRTEVGAWVTTLTEDKGLAPATVNLVYGYMATVMRAAVNDQLIRRTPCFDINLPEIEPTKAQPIDAEQVGRLVAAMPDRYKALVVLAVGTGLRQGECFGLTVQHVDFLRKTLRVEQQVNIDGGPLVLTTRLKTKTSRRSVPLPQLVVDALAAHIAAYPVTHPDGLIFTTTYGNPIRRTSWVEAVWWPATKRADLEGLGFHALRHTYASLLIRHGESVKVVQARLGHKSAQETLDTYGHIWDDQQQDTRDAVDAALAGVSRAVSRDLPSDTAVGV
jgi:integrase